tara:strand:+ start:751 stop:1404 length:654 start_codon:yes stop_codon:yes gene_type:complete
MMLNKYTIFATIFFLLFNGCGKKSTKKESKETAIPNFKLENASYNLDSFNSQLHWVGKEISTKTHTGSLTIKNGKINIDADGLINGMAEIDMTSINVTDLKDNAKSYLEGHLRSPDFFHVELYPTAFIAFKSENNNIINNTINLSGQLTIKDISHPIHFAAVIISTEPILKAKANLSFDRTKYNIRFRSGKFFENLGDQLILDQIDVDVVLVTKQSF